MSRIHFYLDPEPPFRLDLTAWAIRRRPDNEIDFWDGEIYQRVLNFRKEPVLISVAQPGGVDAPRLDVTASSATGGVLAKNTIEFMLEGLLGLRVPLKGFYDLAANQPHLQELSSRFRGLKPPRFPTIWEGLVNGIACQQLSLTVGIMLLNRLSAACGMAYPHRGRMRHAFPRPEEIAVAAPETIRSLGFSRAKTLALIELARSISLKRLDLDSFSGFDNERAISRLEELRGVGRWTAEYTLLRGMGRIDIFPGDDIGARNNLKRWMRLREPLDYAGVVRVVKKWSPYGGLIYFHLLLDSLAKTGLLDQKQQIAGQGYRYDQTETGLRRE